MAIGRDILDSLGMDISFKEKTISWEGITIPMRDLNTIRKYQPSKTELKAFISEAEEPVITQKATDRIFWILNANYINMYLKVVAQQANHLNPRGKGNSLQLAYQISGYS